MKKETGQKLEMQKRRIALPDGRYLIFFDFSEVKTNEAAKDRPLIEKASTEEKNV